MTDLIDTTEMYLKTVYELAEDGVTPLRARIAERLGHSGPTVSQTVARMERDGLLVVTDDRHLELTNAGQEKAMRVMRKHRLAERLLTDVIKLDWELVHVEACRWEHVMSELVEKRLVALLDHPYLDPYGNLIPGLEELGVAGAVRLSSDEVVTLADFAVNNAEPRRARIERISELIQVDVELLGDFAAAGFFPGREILVSITGAQLSVIVAGGKGFEIAETVARHIFVVPYLTP